MPDNQNVTDQHQPKLGFGNDEECSWRVHSPQRRSRPTYRDYNS